MDRLTRKELKSDKFAQEVGVTVDFLTAHKQEVIRYGGAALAIIVLLTATYFYRKHQHIVRQQALAAAIELQETNVGPSPGGQPSFPTQDAKDKAVIKAFGDLAAKYAGSDEGAVAEYFLGVIAADKGNLTEAQKHFQEAADSASADYASLAKMSLAQIAEAQGRVADGEKLIQSVIDHPTNLVSKEQAQVALGQLLASTKPDEARKLLEPLRSARGPISRAALATLGQISQQAQK